MSGAARGALRRFAAALASDQSPLASSNRAALAAVGTHLMRRGRSLSSKPAEFTFGDEDQARRYDDALASQVFRPWCEAMVEINEPVPGNKVLDLACGTVRSSTPRISQSSSSPLYPPAFVDPARYPPLLSPIRPTD